MTPPLVVLGFAERAAYAPDLSTGLSMWNVLGLKHVIAVRSFPYPLVGLQLALAVRTSAPAADLLLRFVSESGEIAGELKVSLKQSSATEGPRPEDPGTPPMLVPTYGFMPAFLPLSHSAPLVFREPGQYAIHVQDPDGTDYVVGTLVLALQEVPPLTPEAVAAIKSDPLAVKAVRSVLGCRHCDDKLTVVVGLERTEKLVADGAVWYQDLPDSWACKCGKSKHDLRLLRRTFHGLLGMRHTPGTQHVDYTPVYEKGALDALARDFEHLLDEEPEEERLQLFIEQNPMLLHQFPSIAIHFKPPILTKFRADFAIVTPQKELLLIEIERSSMRLLKKDGHESAALTHASNQVHDWLHELDQHRLAALDSMGIAADSVAKVSGVVIAGRDKGNDALQLRRLKGVDRGRITFMTFDDLLVAIKSLANRVRKS